jgi:serine/threonine protein kinase
VDYCAGGSLADYMPVEEAEARSWLAEIINGLHYLHGQGIIHRDIKPNNVFFRKPNKEDLVIGDFGVKSRDSNHFSAVGVPLTASTAV